MFYTERHYLREQWEEGRSMFYTTCPACFDRSLQLNWNWKKYERVVFVVLVQPVEGLQSK